MKKAFIVFALFFIVAPPVRADAEVSGEISHGSIGFVGKYEPVNPPQNSQNDDTDESLTTKNQEKNVSLSNSHERISNSKKLLPKTGQTPSSFEQFGILSLLAALALLTLKSKKNKISFLFY
ncbi:LPXTG cell wall anchor domain-containing protein [Lactococcus nasutitermitis]|uniref:LPXTG cell wall anchor domain-containing protein n=1 Tax=Lactococcus nasutitermitis TaxID=1652957 RepID=A0ABV9JC95_9LACT|nr:LPXTG cell wall anchor domain-containing protein [Lactococcus nasutitermitis]